MFSNNFNHKAKFSLILGLIAMNCIFASVPPSSVTPNQALNYAKTTNIDLLDSVVFDIASAVKVGNVISFPIAILSDDTVNALDFSFKYNQSTFTYDSITDLTTYLQALAFYNPNDSTVRFTSNSFQRYANNTALVMVHFTLLTSQFVSSDINTIKGYLNGNVCSIKLTPVNSTGINAVESNQNIFSLFPNPAQDAVQVVVKSASSKADMEIINSSGSILLMKEINLKDAFTLRLSNFDWPAGIYFVKLKTENAVETKKLIIYK